MAADNASEIEKELSDIRREVIESRNLVIKTDNLLRNLHAELKMVGKRQEDFEKRQWFSSAAAYVLFAVLCAGGAAIISSSRATSIKDERDRLSKSVGELNSQVDKQKSDWSSAGTASRAANEVYQMMTTLPGDQRLKGIDALAKLDQSKLTPLERRVLSDRAEELRKEVGQSAYERGKTAYRRNEMSNVVQELSRFLALNPPQADALDASFYLGAAYNQLRKHEQAVPLLAKFVQEDRRAKTRDYAMMLLAHSYEQTGQLEKAMETARDALGTYPESAFQGELRTRLASAKRLMSSQQGGGEAAATVPAPGAAPAAVPAAPAPANKPAP
ncbi:MAG TPA: tetratricopeptide repeat protein [Myxococcaceae bacterium]|nr:tetratricopeptide repeat protein [Myxococcaceae bacterium]